MVKVSDALTCSINNRKSRVHLLKWYICIITSVGYCSSDDNLAESDKNDDSLISVV